MPNNKKKSSKKGNKPSNVATNNDKNKGLHAFANSKNMSANKLTQLAPDIAQDIRDGKIDPKHLPTLIRESLEKQELAKLKEEFRGVKKIVRVGNDIQKFAGGDLLLCDLCKTAVVFNEDIAFEFAQKFYKFERWKDSVRKQFVLNGSNKLVKILDKSLLKKVQMAFDKTCDELEWRIIPYTKKPIKEYCTVYKVPFTVFVDRCVELINRGENLRLEDVARESLRRYNQ
jgi:hypothetical protein